MSGGEFTHLDAEGRARMVDVSQKAATHRVAIAAGRVHVASDTLARLARGEIAKGDALAVARIAGLQGGKATSQLIPLCHPLRLDDLQVELALRSESSCVEITATARAFDRTGVEMEAMTAVSVAALALYDMVKGVDRSARIDGIRLLEKRGGKSGVWLRAEQVPGEDDEN